MSLILNHLFFIFYVILTVLLCPLLLPIYYGLSWLEKLKYYNFVSLLSIFKLNFTINIKVLFKTTLLLC